MGMLAKFRVLHYLFTVNKRDKIIAHCLNFDLVASADTLKEAERRLDTVVRFHIETFLKSNGLSGLGVPAPENSWAEYADTLRQGGALPPSTLRINIPEVVPMDMPYGDLEIVSAKAA